MKTEPIYELTCVLRGSLKEAEQQKAVEQVESRLAKLKAEVKVAKELGRSALAYSIQEETKGYYHYWEVRMTGAKVRELELELQRSPAVIRYLVIRKVIKTN